MKKKIILMFIIMALVLVTGCENKKNNNEDALKFKNEYEEYNDKVNESNGKKYRNVNIGEDNPVVYKSADEIVDLVNDKETFVVYFGFATCPWCRSVLETFLEVVDDLDIKNVYYVDVKEIRDVIEYKDGEKVTTKKGSDGYYKLLDIFDGVLGDYKLYDDDKNEVKTGEKRIYAPNMVYVKKGKVMGMDTGVSSKLTDPYMEISSDMKKETYNKFKKLLSK